MRRVSEVNDGKNGWLGVFTQAGPDAALNFHGYSVAEIGPY
jgi:hypothetical protein